MASKPTVQVESDFPFNRSTTEFCRCANFWASNLHDLLGGGVSLRLMGDMLVRPTASFSWRGRVIAVVYMDTESYGFYLAGDIKFGNSKDAWKKVFRPKIRSMLREMHAELDEVREKVDKQISI